MLLLQIKPLVTDWIQAIGILIGVPLTILSIFRLFRENREKNEKLRVLEDISISHNAMLGKMKEQISELQNQTDTFIIHNQLVKESNLLHQQQVEILKESIESGQIQSEKYLQSLDKTRKADFKPYFRKAGGLSTSERIRMEIRNVGEKAVMDEPEVMENPHVWVKYQYQANALFENNKIAVIEISTKNRENAFRDNNVEFKIYYSNAHGDKYYQQVKFKGSQYTLEPPVDL